MGPLSKESGDSIEALQSREEKKASMGPLSKESGDRPGRTERNRRRLASMGPLSKESGDFLSCVQPISPSKSFNGAALQRERRPSLSIPV